MTDERGGSADRGPGGDASADGAVPDREARLRELLSVDVDLPFVAERATDPPSGRVRTQQVVSALVLVVLLLTGGGLVWAGAGILRGSTQGEVVHRVQDPSAPGYEALLDPTPTLAVLHDVDGTVDSITVLTLPDADEGGGGVVFVPTRVVVDIPLLGTLPLEAGYDLGSPSVQAEVVGDVLTAAIGEVAVVDAARWEGLVAPVAPLTIDNPDAVEVDGEEIFPVGEVELAAEDVGPYLRARVPGESDLARLYRHELFWRAWLEAVRASDRTDTVPGELSSGIGRFVRTIAEGQALFETLPVVESSSDEFGEEPTFQADVDAIAELVARVIPFPRSPRPGVRPRVRILNGTTDTSEAVRVAVELPPAGVEVVLVGNAGTFDHEQTTIAYVDEEHRPEAEALREVLGVGSVLQDPRPSDVVDITVTLGADHD